MDELEKIKRQNALILQAAGEGIYGLNHKGLTTFVNPAAATMLGWSADALIGRSMHTLLHHSRPDGSHYPVQQCPIYAAFKDGAIHCVDDEVFWRKNGTAFPVEYTSTPIYEDGQLAGAVVVFKDISERKQAEMALHQAYAEVKRLTERLKAENTYLQEEIRVEHRYQGIVGKSSAIEHIIKQIQVVAPTHASVLINGESGTGKELIARAIHQGSDRHQRPLIRVNCAAIPTALFESEFFGHVKGAFTGALKDRVGRFQLADGGTIFLDEVGEIPLDLQSKLLRVLQEGQFERIGDSTTQTVDVRVVAATNRDLKTEVLHHRFREDLYYRLNVFPLKSPALRDRLQDIPLLAQHFIQLICSRLKRPRAQLSAANIEQLQQYSWQGNIRELQNVIERAIIVAKQGRLQFDLTPDRVQPTLTVPPEDDNTLTLCLPFTEATRQTLEKANIRKAIQQCQGRISGNHGAAKLLAVKPTTLQSRMKKLGIKAK